ncbi:MAG: cytochrome c oxidase subunit II [Solirubrobacteraceae bacterium]|nr:cytochrome c oxidase subunit II [Solirubrobacteraceae bacterium]
MAEETVSEEVADVQSDNRPRRERVHVFPLLVIGLVATAIGIALGLAIDWFPVEASTQAESVDLVYHVLIVASVPFFVLVTTIVLYCVWQFRERPGEEGLDGPSTHGSTGLEIVWTTIPALLLIALCTFAYVELRDIEEAPAKGKPELIVDVTGQQFAWTFAYPKVEGGAVKTAELVLPEGVPVKFNVKSLDVIHDFWVPEFRMKIDAVPGITTSYRVTPSKEGTYSVVCAELCGVGHALMRQKVTVVSGDRYEAWLKKRQAGGAAAGGGKAGGGAADPIATGKTIFAEGNAAGATPCGACHTLADAGTAGTTGPNLDEVLAGWTPEQISEAITDPNKDVAEGFAEGIMPGTYGDTLTKPELAALVAYLEKTAAK